MRFSLSFFMRFHSGKRIKRFRNKLFFKDVPKLIWLHESSGMNKILDRLKIIDDDGLDENEKLTRLRNQAYIFESFGHIIYNIETLGFIVQV